MGHKVNPTIFRLGISKSWPYQLKTNKNFIKNLFIFRLLKNLFMNYSIPFFHFKKRRNRKINDKIILRGESQIKKSIMVKTNVLFSHVFFASLNRKITIDSFYLDANIKQSLKKDRNPQNPFIFWVKEYKHWETRFYKQSYIHKKKLKLFYHSEHLNTVRVMFVSRLFYENLISCDNYRIEEKKKKTFTKLLRDFFLFIKRNFNPRYYYRIIRIISRRKNIAGYFKIHQANHNNRFLKRAIFRLQKYYINNPNKKFPRRMRRKLIKKLKENNKLLRFNLKKIFKVRKFSSILYLKKLLKINREKKRLKNLHYRIRQRKKFKYKMKNFKPTRLKKRYIPYGQTVYPYRRIKYKYFKRIMPVVARLKSYVKRSSKTVSKSLLKVKNISSIPLNVFNIISTKQNISYDFLKNLKLFKYFLRSLHLIVKFGTKKRIFFFHAFTSIVHIFLGVMKRSILRKKLFIVLQLMLYYNYTLVFYNFLHVKKKYLKKFIFFKVFSKTVFRSIQELANFDKMLYTANAMSKFRFGSSLLLNYILIKLGQYFNIHEIVNPLSYFIKYLTSIAGYKIFVRGRLSRKERAAVLIRSGNKMPLSTVKANIDYSSGFKIMKFGVVGIRVYLYLNHSWFLELYKFKFNYAKISQ